MPDGDRKVFLRYWGSHFKVRSQVNELTVEFRTLVERGWQCYLVLEREPEDQSWLEDFRQMGVGIICLPRPRSSYDWRTVLGVFRLCRRVRPIVLVCANMHTPILMGAWLARVPVRIWSKLSMNTAYEQCLSDTWRNRIVLSVRLTCWLATGIAAVSASVKDELVRLGVPASRVWVRHIARRNGRVVSQAEAAQVRKECGFSEKDMVLVTVGHAIPVKGWDVLVAAFARVIQQAPQARLLFVGSVTSGEEQSHFAELKRFLTERSLLEKVAFAGYCGDVPLMLAAANIFVLPSRSEGCSYALIEAMQAGLPCVVTRVGAASEVVAEGVNGFLVERCDEEGLATALLRLVKDDALRASFAARTVVPPCIPTLPEYAEQMARDYESLLPERA